MPEPSGASEGARPRDSSTASPRDSTLAHLHRRPAARAAVPRKPAARLASTREPAATPFGVFTAGSRKGPRDELAPASSSRGPLLFGAQKKEPRTAWRAI